MGSDVASGVILNDTNDLSEGRASMDNSCKGKDNDINAWSDGKEGTGVDDSYVCWVRGLKGQVWMYLVMVERLV